ncbi:MULTISPECIES: hypothetical protein [Rhizobium]|jgi:hypothetical protein|uniref:Outer membrane lipoprotein n=2 Tax=Rhizobium TaxID=379 RepID=A0A6P1C641_RHITR|nr:MULTISPECIES: hypothetical protein [Rhizobium]AGB72390.1 outer membrane lipoprotein [Rhizobium tropici CIAT 899]MBB3427602.1 hypothetical protein [Rhizobium sp. BK312]MBB4243202.1 hypothetical protein [Rhizobium tropici]MBB5594845.1 hypothetical protein [Rhizobium tropici]MBB6493528.1 hypothetical protein [Rhizobium tropici]
MKMRTVLALVAAAAALSACVDFGGSRPPPMGMNPGGSQPRMNSVEGSWADSNGLNSTFNGGRFETHTTDGTNQQMASGTYTTDPSGVIQINLYSNIKRTSSKVNCFLANPSQLNCTSETGGHFSLNRQG